MLYFFPEFLRLEYLQSSGPLAELHDEVAVGNHREDENGMFRGFLLYELAAVKGQVPEV